MSFLIRFPTQRFTSSWLKAERSKTFQRTFNKKGAPQKFTCTWFEAGCWNIWKGLSMNSFPPKHFILTWFVGQNAETCQWTFNTNSKVCHRCRITCACLNTNQRFIPCSSDLFQKFNKKLNKINNKNADTQNDDAVAKHAKTSKDKVLQTLDTFWKREGSCILPISFLPLFPTPYWQRRWYCNCKATTKIL